MNDQGRFADDEPRVRLGHGLSLSEADVNELAQAKGANAAGLRVLAESYGVPLERIERLYLAGGFARHMDVAAAAASASCPICPTSASSRSETRRCSGASMALLSRSAAPSSRSS